MTLVELLYRLGKAFRNYRDPLWLLAQRALGLQFVNVTDSRTGLRFRCRAGADRMFGETFHAHLYDIPMCPVAIDDLVIDIGASHGFASCYFAYKGAEVIAFEPSPDSYSLFVQNVLRNGLSSKINAIRAAVGAKEAIVPFLETDALGGGMSSVNAAFARSTNIGVRKFYKVEMRSIRSVLASLGGRRVRLLKLDCEGSELEILSELTRDDLDRIDSFAIEYHPQAYSTSELVKQILAWRKFVVYKVPPGDVENANLHVVGLDVIRDWSERN